MGDDKIQVGLRAVTQRVNRALVKEGQKLMKSRSGDDWYIVDTNLNTIVVSGCSIETVAREVGALKPWEEIGE